MTKQETWRQDQKVDISNCSKEPIHIPGKIQPHGILLALSQPDWLVRHASANTKSLFGFTAQELIGKPLEAFLEKSFVDDLKKSLSAHNANELNPVKLVAVARGVATAFDAIVHQSNGVLVLELEKTIVAESDVSFSNIYRKINSTLATLESAQSVASLCDLAAKRAKLLSGFHRVMLYQFDADWNGKVVAEAKESHQQPFLGLQYPASDIPAQARALYETNWIRLIPDVSYQPVEIIPSTQVDTHAPLDLSFSVLRSVSPMHIQYLKNMRVGASMSVSILKGGKLWGLIAFHHESPRYLPYELRQGLEFIGKHFSAQLAAKERNENVEYRSRLKALQPKLLASMKRSPEFLQGLLHEDANFLSMAEGSTGGAICHRGKVRLHGMTPSLAQTERLIEWLKEKVGQTPLFLTESLASELKEASEYKDLASGLLCISIPEPDPSYVIWFKPEVLQTVNWSGNPEKPVEASESGIALGPRRSFELWQETVKLRSLPWAREELDAVQELRRSIIEVDLERQVVAAMESNAELDQFAHLIAHDLKEPLRGIGAFAAFVRDDERDKLGTESKVNLDAIIELSAKMKSLIQTLYEYSKVGRVEFSFDDVDLDAVFRDVTLRLKAVLAESRAELRVPRKLPVAFCDRARIGEVLANLIANAVKYNDKPGKWVEVGYVDHDGNPLHRRFYVRDNGIGISDENRFRIFKMFERLHEAHEYGGGTGSGLALVKRIIDRHRGKLWVESKTGEGSTFFFTLEPGP